MDIASTITAIGELRKERGTIVQVLSPPETLLLG